MWFPTWMALENDPVAQGYGFGTPLTGPGSEGNENDPIPWKEGSQAFGIGVMHQMHCVVSIKMALNDHRYFGGLRFNSTMAAGHIDHCVEVLRQATICHGDLALLRPDVPGMGEYTAYDGWGNEHICRDWDAIQEILKEHGIYYAISEEMKGWTHWRYSAD
ncbi:hypothetical protein LY78DRAFT_649819 [Colletotrichum sublineola]|nr:hypothetical protein LY78DRAFT_649819 [Colletotrichum sublineola]